MLYCIIITGHPCSGKTTISNMLKDRIIHLGYIENESNIKIINEFDNTTTNSNNGEHDGCTTSTSVTSSMMMDNSDINTSIRRMECYGTSEMEKKTRGNLKASFDRAIASFQSQTTTKTKNTNTNHTNTKKNKNQQNQKNQNHHQVIILDSLNYIKGYRYELYCISKATQCVHCVVWCLSSIESVKEWNTYHDTYTHHTQQQIKQQKIQVQQRYSTELLNELILRYEPPDDRNRWDKPLYKIYNHNKNNTNIQQKQHENKKNPIVDAGDNNNNNNNIERATPTPEQQQQQQVGNEKESDTRNQQQQEQQQKPTIHTDQQVLSQSVYNMHNLAQVMNHHHDHNSASTEVSSTIQQVQQQPRRSTLTSFKRAPKKNTATVPVAASQTPITTMKRGTLTAEALATHHEKMVIITPTSVPSLQTPTTTTNVYHPQHQEQPFKKEEEQKQKQSTTTTTTTTSDLPILEQMDSMIQDLFKNIKPLHEGTSTKRLIATNSNILQLITNVTKMVCQTILTTQQQQTQQQKQKEQQYQSSKTSNTLQLHFHFDDDNDTDVQNQGTILSLNLPVSGSSSTNTNRTNDYYYYTNVELDTIRQQYMQWCKMNPPTDTKFTKSIHVAKLFLSYIEHYNNQ